MVTNTTTTSTNSSTSKSTNVYYSTKQGWVPPNDKNAVVVYINKTGKTTGQTTAGDIPQGIDVREQGINTQTGQQGNIGTLLAQDIKSQTSEQKITSSTGTGYNPATKTNIPSYSEKQSKVLGQLEQQGVMQQLPNTTQYTYGRVSSITTPETRTGQAYLNINRTSDKPLLITPEEAKRNPSLSSQFPVWVVQSPNTPLGMINAINIESKYASTPVYRPNYGMPYSKGYFETNQALLGKSMFEYQVVSNPKLTGTPTPEYSSFQLNARREYYKLPITTQIKLEGAELYYGAVKFGESSKQFIAQTNLVTAFSMGRYQVKNGEVISGNISQTFSKTNIPSVPHIKGQNWFTELVTERPATTFQVGAGAYLILSSAKQTIGNIQQFGFKEGLGTSLAGFSPINLEASGGFDISKRLIEAPPSSKRISFINKQGITTTIQETKIPAKLGSADLGINIRNVQSVSPTGKGFGIQETTAPIWTYRGGVLTNTQVTTKSLNLFQPSKVEGIFDVTSISKGGIRTTRVSGVDQKLFKTDTFSIGRFASGEVGNPLIKTGDKSFDLETGFKTQFKGYSVVYGSSTPETTGTDTQSFMYKSGGTKTSLSKTFKPQTEVINVIPQNQLIKIQTKQTIVPTQLQTKTSTKQETQQVSRTSLAEYQIVKNILDTKVISIPKYNTLTRTSLSSPQVLIQPQITKQITRQVATAPSIPITNMPFTPIPIIPPIFNFPSMDLSGTRRVKNIRGKQPKRYTPSYEAIVFNIRGKKPKGIETGARVRPITKGFSFSNKIKLGNLFR